MRQTEGGTSNKVKIVTTPELIAAAAVAKRTHRNRQLDSDFLDILDPEGIHVVVWSMIHNDAEVRVRLLMKRQGSMSPVEGWLDVPFKTHESWRLVDAPDVSQEVADV